MLTSLLSAQHWTDYKIKICLRFSGNAEFAGVENVAPWCRGGKRGRREIMETEYFNNLLLSVL